MALTLSSFTVSADKFQPGSEFTVSLTTKNNIGAAATLAKLDAWIEVPRNDEYGDYDVVGLYSSGYVSVSWANNATKSMTFSGAMNGEEYDGRDIWEQLNDLLESYPNAGVRANAVHWSFELAENEMSSNFGTGYADKGVFYDAFYAPAIEAFQLERSMDGVPNDEGESLLTTLKLGIAERYRLELLSLKLYYAENAAATTASPFIDLTASIPDLLAGVTDSAELITKTFVNISNWNFLLVFGDAYESASAALSVSRAFANVHLSGKSTGGVALGGFSTSEEGDPKFESHYPAHFYAGISDFGGSVQGGTVTRTEPSVPAQSYKSYKVTFPIPFKEIPVVTCSLYSWSTSYYMGGFCLAISAGTITKTGFTVNCYNSTSSARDFHLAWIAIGKM